MALKCSICQEPIHWKLIEGQRFVYRCPNAPYKHVKMYYTDEIKDLGRSTGLSLTDSPEDILNLAKIVPEESPLMQFVKIQKFVLNGFVSGGIDIFTKNLLIHSDLSSFFLHFNRVLIELFDKNPELHYVSEESISHKSQFNYKYINPMVYKEAFFSENKGKAQLDSFTSLVNPSLVIYPLGKVLDIKNYNATRGDLILALISSRQASGKATWLIADGELSSFPEIQGNSKLEALLKTGIPKVTLKKEEIFEEDDLGSSDLKKLKLNKLNDKNVDYL